jgi:hypothetical protein
MTSDGGGTSVCSTGGAFSYNGFEGASCNSLVTADLELSVSGTRVMATRSSYWG